MSCIVYQTRHHGAPSFRLGKRATLDPFSNLSIANRSVFGPRFGSIFNELLEWPDDVLLSGRHSAGGHDAAPGHWTPRADVSEDEAGFTVSVEVPGIPHKDISISLDQGTLKVSGKTRKHTKASLPKDAVTGAKGSEAPASPESSGDQAQSKDAEANGKADDASESASAASQSESFVDRSFSLSYALTRGTRRRGSSPQVVIDEANVQAKLENGLLEIRVPKVAPPKPVSIPISYGSAPQAVTEAPAAAPLAAIEEEA